MRVKTIKDIWIGAFGLQAGTSLIQCAIFEDVALCVHQKSGLVIKIPKSNLEQIQEGGYHFPPTQVDLQPLIEKMIESVIEKAKADMREPRQGHRAN